MRAERSIVQQRPANQAYQSIGGLALPTDLSSGQITGPPVTVRERRASDDKPGPFEHLAQIVPETPATVAPPTPPPDLTSPGAVIKAAKARIRAIKRELRSHAALKNELAQLERLVAAAKTKPAPKVRAIRGAG